MRLGFDGKTELIGEQDTQDYQAWLRVQPFAELVEEVVHGWSYLSACLALGEMARRSPRRALPVVLEQLSPDSMIHDCAFMHYYAIDRAAALRYVEAQAEQADVWLFGTMLSEVAGDVGLLPEAAELLPVARSLLRLLRERQAQDPDELRSIAVEIEFFMQAFGDLE